MARARTPLAERFHSKYTPEPNSGCWLWIGADATCYGYGKILGPDGRAGGSIYAHRASWLLHFGEIPDNLWVLHKCDVPCCVNPDHLFLGTHSDNMQDCARKKRNAMQRHPESSHFKEHRYHPNQGEKHRSAKLTGDKVREIRLRYSKAHHTGQQAALAREYGVGERTISAIVRHQTWKHIP